MIKKLITLINIIVEGIGYKYNHNCNFEQMSRIKSIFLLRLNYIIGTIKTQNKNVQQSWAAEYAVEM